MRARATTTRPFGRAPPRERAPRSSPSCLEVILEALRKRHTTDQESDHLTDQVARLLVELRDGPKGAVESHGHDRSCRHRPTFRNNYIRPALEAGLIEMTRPESPTARNQRYRLTARGRGGDAMIRLSCCSMIAHEAQAGTTAFPEAQASFARMERYGPSTIHGLEARSRKASGLGRPRELGLTTVRNPELRGAPPRCRLGAGGNPGDGFGVPELSIHAWT